MNKEELVKLINEEGNYHEFMYKSYKCIMIRHNDFLHWCGYVVLPKTSIFYGMDYYISKNDKLTKAEEIINNMDVHGGLTFSGNRTSQIDNKEYFCLGFDCAHYDDITILDNIDESTNKTYKTKEFVIQECQNMVDSFIEDDIKNINNIIIKTIIRILLFTTILSIFHINIIVAFIISIILSGTIVVIGDKFNIKY